MRRFNHRNDQKERLRLQAIHKEREAQAVATPVVDVEQRWLQASDSLSFPSFAEKAGMTFPSILEHRSNQAQCSSCRLFIGRREVPYPVRPPCTCFSPLQRSQLHHGSQRGDDHCRDHSEPSHVPPVAAEAVAGVAARSKSHV